MPTGRVSWFGGPHDPSDSGHTASGGTTATPGLALYNRATLGGYWKVKFPNGRVLVLKQTDIGPSPGTGRKVDVTYSALRAAGYSEHNFPTDANVQYSYLGKTPPRGGQGASGARGASQGPPGTTTKTITTTPGVNNSALRDQLKQQFLSQSPANPFSARNLAPVGMPDVSKPPAAGPDLSASLTKGAAGTNRLFALAGNLSQAQDVAPTTKTVTQRSPGAPAVSGGRVQGANNLVFRGVQFTPGVVGIGKALQKLGLHVGENPHFGGVSQGVHHDYGYYDHYHGGAIDVSGPSWLLNTVANFLAHHKAQLGIPTSGVPNLGGHRGSGVLYQVPGHFDHLHVSARH